MNGKLRMAMLMAALVWGCAVTGASSASAAVVLAGLPGENAQSIATSEIEGRWIFHKMIYRGGEHPPLNPDLVILFEFRSDGTDRLFWTRLNQPGGFCERLAYYSYSAPFLSEEVYWANPENARECARDPDMIPGKQGTSRLEREGEELFLHLGLGDEPLIYVWRRCEPEEDLCQR